MNYSFRNAGIKIRAGLFTCIECILYRVGKTRLQIHYKLRQKSM